MNIPNLTIIQEGLRIFRTSTIRKKTGWKRYNGDAKQICEQIARNCWNGRYFQASAGHFSQFYCRDFGMSISALIRRGYKEECKKTVLYALEKFKENNGITTAITPSGKPFNFPNVYSPDSTAYFFRTLSILNDKTIIENNREFLEKEATRYFHETVDQSNGLAIRGRHFGGMKDHAIRDSSCYDSVMIAVMKEALTKLNLENPMRNYDVKKEILKRYWRDDHFIDDLSGNELLTADANLYPFHIGGIDDQSKMKKALKSIRLAGLDTSFPTRYEPTGIKPTKQILIEKFVPNWERGTHWTNLAVAHISLLKTADKRYYNIACSQMNKIIEKNRTIFECYNPDGTPYRSAMYHADEGMLWGVNLVNGKKQSINL